MTGAVVLSVLPQLKASIAVATLINLINVFTSLPILRTITGSIPGYEADTLMTYIFKTIQFDQALDTASALSVLNFALVLVVVVVYLLVIKPLKEVS